MDEMTVKKTFITVLYNLTHNGLSRLPGSDEGSHLTRM